MPKFRLAVCTGVAASALLLIPAGSASAHVHGITPLECTAAPTDIAGARQAIEGDKAAEEAELFGVIPREKSELGAELTGGQDAPVPICA
jgi:hypothetical protein